MKRYLDERVPVAPSLPTQTEYRQLIREAYRIMNQDPASAWNPENRPQDRPLGYIHRPIGGSKE